MRADLEARLSLLERELREVDLQEAGGELDTATADRLRSVYRAERAEVEEELSRTSAATPGPPARSRGRMLAGAALLVGALAVIVVAAVGALTEPPSVPGPGQDLSQISNDAMLAVIDANADNPQINAMRLALAERYFEEFDYSAALPQFQAVLDNDPNPTEASEALARMGWMVHASGASDTAENLLDRSLEANPSNTEAAWFLSIVYLDTQRPCEAAELLGTLTADSAVPADAIDDVAALAATAEEECQE